MARIYLTDIEELNHFIKEHKFVVYGTGKVSQLLYRYLKREGKTKNVEGYVQSNISESSRNNDKEVVSVKDLDKKLNNTLVLVATTSQYHDAIMRKIQKYSTKTAYYLSDVLIEDIRLFFTEYPKRTKFGYFYIELVSHCNLNCSGCDHFSPIASIKYLDLNEFDVEMKRMSELMEAEIPRIGLLGGEPLLHPDIEKILPIARKYFPNSEIDLITNGLLLKKQKQEFYLECKNQRITICATKYPINYPYDSLPSFFEKWGISFKFYGDVSKEKVCFIKRPIDLCGKQNPILSWHRCTIKKSCLALSHGKLSCGYPMHIGRFNQAFRKNIEVTEQDYIDIYRVKTKKDILDFLSKPLSFCRYCDVMNIENVEYKQSNKSILEWI